MATNNVINGTMALLQTGASGSTTPYAFSTSASISLSMDTRDISNKASAGWRELLEAQMSWSASCEGLYAFADSGGGSIKNYNELFDLLITRTATYLELTTDTTGNYTYGGNAYLTSIEQSAPMEDNMTFSATFEGTGALAVSTDS